MTVKPPTGMQEELARPVIEVVEFPSGKLTHEMFAFGSEIAVAPLEARAATNDLAPVRAMAKDRIVETVRQWVGVECQVRFSSDTSAVIYAPSNMISTLVGRGGENVKQLQNELGGMRLSIESFDDMPEGMEQPNRFWQDNRKKGNAWENPRRKGKSARRQQRKR